MATDRNDNNIVREGLSAGMLGALAIAIWFGILDAVQSKMFATPTMLGTSIGSLFLGADDPPSAAAAFIGYTIFHFAMFAIIGIVLAWVVNRSERTPSALIGFVGLFVVFEVGWVGWTSVLARSGFGQLSWLQVFVANLIAAGVMGWYIVKQHPAIPGKFNRVLAGAPE